jgi:hypothetical protein
VLINGTVVLSAILENFARYLNAIGLRLYTDVASAALINFARTVDDYSLLHRANIPRSPLRNKRIDIAFLYSVKSNATGKT